MPCRLTCMEGSRDQHERAGVLRTLGRALTGLGLLALLFVLRWRFGGNPYDFQVFRAAEALARLGQDPYDSATLNGELASKPEIYGDLWAEDESGNYRMFFFNPPVWLAQTRGLGLSPMIMSIAGGMLMVFSMVWITMRESASRAFGYALGAFVFMVFGMADTTMWFGQTGLLFSGIVGAYLVSANTSYEGVAVAMLAFKPHLSFALGLPALVARPMKAARRIAVPLLVLCGVTLFVYEPSLWSQWVQGLTSGERTVVYNDLTIRTLSPRFPLPDWSTWPLLLASFIATATLVRRFRHADIGVAACTSLAITAFASGHAFSHDFLWLVFVPIVCRWRPQVAIAVAVGATVPRWSGYDSVMWNLVDVSSLVILVAVAYLVWATRQSHLRNQRSADRVLRGETSVDSKDGSRREHRLAAG